MAARASGSTAEISGGAAETVSPDRDANRSATSRRTARGSGSIGSRSAAVWSATR